MTDPTRKPGEERDADVDRQDATGIDVPAGRSAEELDSSDYRPAKVVEGTRSPSPAREARSPKRDR